MTINAVKGLGLVLAVGMLGGYISTKIIQKKMQKEEDDREHMHMEALESLKTSTKMEMDHEAHEIVRNAITSEVRDKMEEYIQKKVENMDFDQIVQHGIEKGIREATEKATQKITEKSVDIMKDEVRKLTQDTVDNRIKEEMYQVNSRRIIEDSVDRAVRDEVRVQVKDKIKKFNIPSWFSGDDIAKVLYAL